jgi:uncharacterized membrane protein YeaQ/YmgE (transglycosylase-associated protein family)
MKNNTFVRWIGLVIWLAIGMIGAVMHEAILHYIDVWFFMLAFLIYAIIGMVIIIPNEEA